MEADRLLTGGALAVLRGMSNSGNEYFGVIGSNASLHCDRTFQGSSALAILRVVSLPANDFSLSVIARSRR